MNLICTENSQGGVHQSKPPAGFTLIEVMVGVVVLALAVIAMFALLTSGFAMVHFNRDNLRATQIMLNRVEGLRLYNWGALNSGEMPTNFIETYYGVDTTNVNKGTIYTGTVRIEPAPLTPTATYCSNMMRRVTVQVVWTNGSLEHRRQVSTYVSEYGLQNYLLSN